MKLIHLFFSLLIVLTATACGNSGNTENNSSDTPVSPIETVGPEAFLNQMNGMEAFHLLDVRTPEELAETGKLAGAVNLNINNDDFDTQIQALDNSKTVFVYCKSGGRSGKAANKLSKLGFPKVIDMEGGITAWTANGMEVSK